MRVSLILASLNIFKIPYSSLNSLLVEKITEQNGAGRSICKAINGNIGAATPSTSDGKTPLPYASTLNTSSPEEIEAECTEVIRAVEGAGLRNILGPNCWPPAKTPPTNYDTVVYSARKYGRFDKEGD